MIVALKSTVQGTIVLLSNREAYTVYKKLGLTPIFTLKENSLLVYLSFFSAGTLT